MSDPLPSSPPAVIRSHRSWAIEIGRLRVAVTRTSERSVVDAGRASTAGRAWPLVIGTFAGVSALGLAVMGASAATRPALPVPYRISVAVPGAASPRLVRRSRARSTSGHQARVVTSLTEAADGLAPADAPFVGRAMRTGAFQEWDGDDGQHRFLTAGPARVVSGRACRDLALLTRLADGGSRVHSFARCVSGQVSDESLADDAGSSGGTAPITPLPDGTGAP